MAYLSKNSAEMLNTALQKIQLNTPITNISPGSVARAMAELVTSELGDFYDILNFNTGQNLVGTATGQSLDLIASLYGLARQTLTQVASVDASLGVFYFYVTSPATQTIVIPNGTQLYTDNTSYVGLLFNYETVGTTVIPVGHTKAWASIQPNFTTGVYTAGTGTLTVIDPNFPQPAGTTVYCTNPKPIPAQTTQESDDSFRARIIAQVSTAAGGTSGALRFSALNVPGVRDVTVLDAPYGLGTVGAFVVTNDNLPGSPVINTVTNVLSAIKPAGVRLYVTQPSLLPVDIAASIVLNPVASNPDNTNAIQSTTNAIVTFLNQPLVGTPLIYNDLIQAILNATDYTLDVIINDYAVNGAQVIQQNYTPGNTEQLIPGAINVSVAASTVI